MLNNHCLVIFVIKKVPLWRAIGSNRFHKYSTEWYFFTQFIEAQPDKLNLQMVVFVFILVNLLIE